MTGQQVMARLRERDGDGEILGLVKRIARAHDVTIEELLGRDRGHAPSEARRALWASLHERGHWSYNRLAHLFGRDHSTIMAGVNLHRERMGLPPLPHSKGHTYRPPVEAELT